MTNANIPQHIQDKANEMIAKGAKMTFEAICEMYMKSEAKEAKKNNSKKWAQRELVSKTIPTRTAAEIMRENALKNLPSSLR